MSPALESFTRRARLTLKVLSSPLRKHKEARQKKKKDEERLQYLLRDRTPMGEVFNDQRSAITIPEKNDGPSVKRIDPQLNSTLLSRLPLELRQCIWELLAGGMTIHLAIKRQRFFDSSTPDSYWLYQVRCLEENDDACRRKWGDYSHGGQDGCVRIDRRRQAQRGSLEGKWLDMNIVSLLLVCRQMYSEIIRTFYCHNMFTSAEPVFLRHMNRCLLPQRIQTLQHFRFYWTANHHPMAPKNLKGMELSHYGPNDLWTYIWQNIAKMAGLQDFRFIFRCRPWISSEAWQDMNLEVITNLLKPIRLVTAPRSFEICLPFSRTQCLAAEVWESLPCQILWDFDETPSQRHRPREA